MRKKVFLLLIVGTSLAFSSQVQAQSEPQVSEEEILRACQQDRPEVLPIPFTDLDPNHWAFAAVMDLYYCYRYIPSEEEEQV